MKYYKNDITKVLNDYKDGKINLDEAVRQSCLAYDKEVANPTEESVEDRKAAFKKRMEPFKELYPVDMLNKFYLYWTAFKTPKAKLMAFEKAKTFQMGARLITWKQNAINFKLKSIR